MTWDKKEVDLLLQYLKYKIQKKLEAEKREVSKVEKEILQLENTNQYELARTKCTLSIPQFRSYEGLAILQIYLEMMQRNLEMLDREKELPENAQEYIAGIIFAERFAGFEDLTKLKKQLKKKYSGKLIDKCEAGSDPVNFSFKWKFQPPPDTINVEQELQRIRNGQNSPPKIPSPAAVPVFGFGSGGGPPNVRPGDIGGTGLNTMAVPVRAGNSPPAGKPVGYVAPPPLNLIPAGLLPPQQPQQQQPQQQQPQQQQQQPGGQFDYKAALQPIFPPDQKPGQGGQGPPNGGFGFAQ
ncbi:MAG: hypothetical protein EZS28_008769 [Streblomastix strix]|uniref:Uncharacterized protein n=1 Tax=Streblomastix strix TaxID=222440 RepID=A0A5J4WMC2_9EUKA|nr:MAG: hypothetical protein EZS28_008769 [Streblomastix strix]